MFIELTGCSGAGKTTLARRLVQELKKREPRVNQQILPKGVLRPVSALYHLFWELRVLPSFLKRYQQYKKFIQFCLDHVRSYSLSIFQRWRIYKSLYRKLATFCFYIDLPDLCVVDEGIIHTAHILFTHPLLGYRTHDLLKYIQLVPLPDVVIVVEASIPVMLQRMLQRSDPPWMFVDEGQKEQFLKETQELFDHILEFDQLKSRTLIVKTDSHLSIDVELLADDLVSRHRGLFQTTF